MITSFEVQAPNGTSMGFEISNINNGYQVKDIEGLDPVRANIVTTSFANMDGELYQASRREKRNIVITLGLVPDFVNLSVSALRNALYSMLMPKSLITLRFFRTDGEPLTISGRVETFDSPIFTDSPTAVISILCFDPDFLGPEVIVPRPSSSGNTLVPLEYKGNVSSGFALVLPVTRPISGFSIIVQRPGETQTSFSYEGSLLAGDLVTVSTIPGTKFIERVRAGEASSILAGVSPYSDWVYFDRGVNSFLVKIAGTPIPYNVIFNTRFGGL